MVENLEP
jgi:CRP-like cAMP-binding protein